MIPNFWFAQTVELNEEIAKDAKVRLTWFQFIIDSHAINKFLFDRLPFSFHQLDFISHSVFLASVLFCCLLALSLHGQNHGPLIRIWMMSSQLMVRVRLTQVESILVRDQNQFVLCKFVQYAGIMKMH